MKIEQAQTVATVAAAVLMFLAGSAASAQQASGAAAPGAVMTKSADAGAVDPAAVELVDACRKAISKVKFAKCSVVQTTHPEGEEATRSEGDVVVEILRGLPAMAGDSSQFRMGMGKVTKFRLTSAGGQRVHAFDGKMAAMLDKEKATFASMAAEDHPVFPPQDVAGLVPVWLQSDVLSSVGAKVVSAKMLPDERAGGVECKVVEIVVEVAQRSSEDEPGKTPTMILKQTRHIGKDDMLPRKIASATSFRDWADTQARAFSGEYTGLSTSDKSASDAEAFTLTKPEGVMQAKADAAALGIFIEEPAKLAFGPGDAAPAFTLKDGAGSDVTLESLKGRVVLLDFWATWCGPCKAAMPSVQALHERYAGKPVSVFGVNTWERGATAAAKALKYMEDNKYTYRTLLKGDDLAKAYGISGIPTFVLIGPDGKVIHIGVGFSDGEGEHMRGLIDEALKKIN